MSEHSDASGDRPVARQSGVGISLLTSLLAVALLVGGLIFLVGEFEGVRADRARMGVRLENLALPSENLAALPPALARRESIIEFSVPCLRSHEFALQRGDRDGALDTLYICIAILEEGLRRAPQSGDDWITLALALHRANGPQDRVVHAYRMAAEYSPRRQNVALSRIILALRLGDDAPQDVRDKLLDDLRLLTDMRFVSELLAETYERHPEIRERMVAEIEKLEPDLQENFVRTLRRVREGDRVNVPD